MARQKRGAQQVRIIGGMWKRRKLSFPDRPDLRPTPDRSRETLFNWLGHDVADAGLNELVAAHVVTDASDYLLWMDLGNESLVAAFADARAWFAQS